MKYMLRPVILLLAVILRVFPAYAYAAAEEEVKIPDNVIKVTPGTMLDMSGLGMLLGYERRLGRHTSITGEFAIPLLKSAYLSTSAENNVRLRSDVKLRVEGRYYFDRKNRNALWFMSIEGGYRFQDMIQEPGYYKKLQADRQVSIVTYSSGHVTKSVYGIGYTLGNRTRLAEALYIEFQMGIGYHVFYTTHSDMKDVHEETRKRNFLEGKGNATFIDGGMNRVYVPMSLKLAFEVPSRNSSKVRHTP